MLPRILAVDWSGAATGAARKIWLAECRAASGGSDMRLVRLECGRSREGLVAHLLDEVARDPNVVIGLDFSFSFPAWFLTEHQLSHAPTAWALAAREGERWLAEAPYPFWGRPGCHRPIVPEHFRRTEREVPSVAGIRPKSTLQVGGAGSVGTGAIRGMPHLLTLQQAGCAIWPFDAPRLPRAPLVVEIYPRLLTGAVTKGKAQGRADFLASVLPSLPAHFRDAAAASEDALDALGSAIAMGRAAASFRTLGPARDRVAQLEGEIWYPAAG
ncbi:MAG: hypothetical protein IPK33_09660 [Gemmatimonadetes bacterium]|nr:hypothetical protein [Gemmatimonadota bacterium]